MLESGLLFAEELLKLNKPDDGGFDLLAKQHESLHRVSRRILVWEGRLDLWGQVLEPFKTKLL